LKTYGIISISKISEWGYFMIEERDFWYGTEPKDVEEYVAAWGGSCGEKISKKHIVSCDSCSNDQFQLRYNSNEGIVKVICTNCGAEKWIFDSKENKKGIRLYHKKCSFDKNSTFNIGVGFSYRDTGEVRHVFISERCCKCHVLSSTTDWRINYSPTEEYEKNI